MGKAMVSQEVTCPYHGNRSKSEEQARSLRPSQHTSKMISIEQYVSDPKLLEYP